MNDDLFQLGERIVELAARINIATCEMLTLIAEFDRREGWADEGVTSCAEWLAVTTGRMFGTARENVRVAHALEDLPLTSAEMKTGKLSYTKVRTMTRVATPETEKTLLKYARAGSAAKLEQIVRGWKHLSRDGELTAEEARHQSRAFSVVIDGDGMYVMRGRLEPEVGAVLMRAIPRSVVKPRVRTESGEAPGWQGATSEDSSAIRSRSNAERSVQPGCTAARMQRGFRRGPHRPRTTRCTAPSTPMRGQGAASAGRTRRDWSPSERWQRGSVENPGRVPSGSRWRSTPRWPRWRRTGSRAVPRSTG